MPPLSIQVSRPFKTKLGSCFNLPHPPSQISAVGCWWCSSCKGGKSVSGMGGPREKRHQPEREMWTIRRYCTESRNLRPITIYTAALTYETGEERGGGTASALSLTTSLSEPFFFVFCFLFSYNIRSTCINTFLEICGCPGGMGIEFFSLSLFFLCFFLFLFFYKNRWGKKNKEKKGTLFLKMDPVPFNYSYYQSAAETSAALFIFFLNSVIFFSFFFSNFCTTFKK